jgi:aspartyl-tRNA(Asn)/glutamyl-tRNA(Gln) amidotransferase subunit B
MSAYEAVIGLEVHAQLSTNSKMFCGCSAAFGGKPNTHVCPTCLGLPGALPVVNARAVEYAVRLGVATECTVANESIFARKNYFYPDCPKNYQISQFDTPLCEHGQLSIENDAKHVRIRRIHLEEDAGKLVHVDGADHSLVDFNRSGVPLVEIVSEPDIRTPQEASEYLQKLRSLVRYLGICDGNMEEGSLRCDVNLSVRKKGANELGVKTEVKNLNSFKQVEQAIEFETERQTKIVESGGRVTQDTLLWDPAVKRASVMRSKEEAHDYRYFPEPDLRTLRASQELIERVRGELPELPDAKQKRFVSQYGLSAKEAADLTTSRDEAELFEGAAQKLEARTAGNFVRVELRREANERGLSVSQLGVTPDSLVYVGTLVTNATTNLTTAREILKEHIDTRLPPEQIVAKRGGLDGIRQVSDDSAIEKEAIAVLDENPDEVARYLAGKEQLLQFFVGQLMKRTRGKANAQIATGIIKELLEIRRKG